MLTVDEALSEVLARAVPLPSVRCSIERALGCVLAEDVCATADSPPFDKALVDGFAVRAADLANGPRRLRIVEEITAGKVPTRPLREGEAALVMTGAPLPAGADMVVMIERTERRDNEVFFDPSEPVAPGRNRLCRGREMRAGDRLLEHGTRLNPARLGLLASVGRTEIYVVPRPTVAVLPTGDELVEADQEPGPGQIRNSNAWALSALARQCDAEPRPFPVVADQEQPLFDALAAGLAADVLLASGGVSAGTRDLVPGALQSLGVTKVFHKVSLKPGKPLWFGVGPARGEGPGTLVFGLPGNPVSSLVCFLVFVRPALGLLRGLPLADSGVRPARLASPFAHRGDRPTYHPATIASEPTESGSPLVVQTLDWAGSADLRTVAAADGFALFPAGDRDYDPGASIRFLPLP
ncbi:MAG TPA: gephyrin-like molybdotransferase Glp [Isosphaeraceae bacterium]|nr:gephyrin-like molybdotransferase Glp [Isosphaeraceae bacterium]